jgi:hypothetical protein
MAVPWLTVGKLVLGNLDNIIRVVRPAFTRSKVDTPSTQADLLNQQIAELQAASSNNAEQIAQLATQLKEFIASAAQAAEEAAAQRGAAVRLSRIAIAMSVVAVVIAVISLVS